MLCLRASDKVAVQSGWPGPVSHLGLDWGGSHFQAHTAGRIQFLAGYWTEGSREAGIELGEPGECDVPGAKAGERGQLAASEVGMD